MVVLILGILAVTVLPRMNASDYRSAQFHDQTVAALRFAQKSATSHRRNVCVSFPTNASLAIQIAPTQGGSAACTLALNLPSQTSNTLTSPDTTNVVFSPLPTAFTFAPSGATSADQTLQITGADPIVVIGSTGHVR